jgi:hypothetical protein
MENSPVAALTSRQTVHTPSINMFHIEKVLWTNLVQSDGNAAIAGRGIRCQAPVHRLIHSFCG